MLSVVVCSRPVMTAVNGTLVARPVGDLAHGRRLCKTGAGYDRVPDCSWARKRANRATQASQIQTPSIMAPVLSVFGTARRRDARRPAYRTSRRAGKQVRHGFRDDDRFLVVAGLEVRRFVGHPVEGGMVLWPLGSSSTGYLRLPGPLVAVSAWSPKHARVALASQP